MNKFVLVAAVLLLVAGKAAAGSFSDLLDVKKPNLHVGPLELHPYYTLAEAYESNIYLVPRDQANGVHVGGGVLGSWITKNTLGLDAVLPVGRQHRFEGGYEFEAQNYTTQSSANDNIQQKVRLSYDYTGARGLSGKVSDRYINTTDPAFSELITRSHRWQNQAAVSAAYAPEGNRFNAGVDYADTVHKYLDPALAAILNRSEQSVGVKGGYKVLPKTNVFAAYHRGITHYSVVRAAGSPDKNSKSHSFDFGVEGDILPNLTGIVKTGLHTRHFDEAGANGQTKTQNWTYGAQLLYQPTARTAVDLSFDRALQESISGNSRFYISNEAFLTVRHQLPYKLTAAVDLGIAFNKYPEAQTTGGFTANRRDDLYMQGVSLKYDIREWLSTTLGYNHRERNSIFTGQYNYEDHVTSLALAVKL